LCVCLGLSLPTLFAQVETRKIILLNTAKSLDQESRASYSAAVIKAKEKGWPLFYQSTNQSQRALIGIDNFGMPIYYSSFSDPIHAITVNTNKLWPTSNLGYNLTGASDSLTNTLAVFDQGAVRTTHYELKNRVVQKDNATTAYDHGTHVLGIMMAKGINPAAKGMSFNLKGAYSYDWNNDASEMAAAAANGLLISNHSYGIVAGWDYNSDSSRWEFGGNYNENEDYKFGLYNNAAMVYDSVMYNAPYYLIVKAAGNNHGSTGPAVNSTYWRRDQNGKWYNAGNRPAGISSNDSYETLSSDINAKNLLVVGAVNGIGASYSKKEDVVMSSFSSWGPTDDGRIKPDIVADGVSVYSSIATNDSSYAALNGTSMATPNAAGSLLLLQELSQQLSPKKFIKAATLKALAIHTANEAGDAPGPDYKFGWGLLNMYDAANVLSNALTTKNSETSKDFVYENVLNNLDSNIFTITASGLTPVKATVVWNDVKGTPKSTLNDPTPQLINDLDVTITQGSKLIQAWKLNPQIPSNAAYRGDNVLDNVEKVEVDTTLIGKTYSIKVKHKGNLARGQQAYSLIISGAGGTASCASNATSNAGTKIDSVSINNIQFTPTVVKEYVDNSNLYITGEPNGTVNVFVKLGSADATNNTRFVKTFVDYNSNGTFEDNELVLTSTGISNSNYTANFTIPDTIPVGRLLKYRMVVMETSAASNVNACGTYAMGETQDYTLKIIAPSTDMQMAEIISPDNNACKKDIQYVTVRIINNGSSAKTNIPLSVTVSKGSTQVFTASETFTGKLGGGETMNYTFQKPFSSEANQSYTITATVNIANDQQKNNNSLSNTFTTAANNPTPVGTALNCNGAFKLAVTNPITGKNYLWYDTSALIIPIALGPTVNTSTTKNNLYLAEGFQTIVGPATNTTLANTGGYNAFNGNFVKFSTTTPLTIETTKLYTGYPGKISIILATLATFNADGSYSYYPIQTANLNVGASSPSPAAALTSSGTPFVTGDTGRIYHLNLQVPQAGDYILIMKCDSATVFRNNGLSDPTYPIGPSKVFSFTGNSVTSPSNFQNYFYFFYNTQIRTNDCLSPAATIPVSVVPKPIVVYKGDSLTTNSASNYQWYVNDEIITGATGQVYRPTKNGLYKVVTTTNSCQTMSDNNLILVTDLAEGNTKEIALKITSNDYIENMIKGNSFYVQFANIQTQGITLELFNAMGNKVAQVKNLINQRTPQKINIDNFMTGVYFVKIYANNKVYVQRVLLSNN